MGIYVLFLFFNFGAFTNKTIRKTQLFIRLYEYMFLMSWVTPRRRMVESHKEYVQFLFKKLKKNNFLNIFQDFITHKQRSDREGISSRLYAWHPTKLFSKILDILTNDWGFPFCHIFTSTWYILTILIFTFYNSYMEVSSCGFSINFSKDYWFWHSFNLLIFILYPYFIGYIFIFLWLSK